MGPDTERARLVSDYHRAVSEFSRAVKHLHRLPETDFPEGYRRVEETWDAAERARQALEDFERTIERQIAS